MTRRQHVEISAVVGFIDAVLFIYVSHTDRRIWNTGQKTFHKGYAENTKYLVLQDGKGAIKGFGEF